MKTIGIWGFYFAENFGDDLMALQFSEIVKNLGAKPLVYDLSPILGARYNIDTTRDICDFCARSEIILIGGGNLLAQDHTWPSGPFMKKISELRLASEHWNRPIHAISVGGDGYLDPKYPYDVECLLNSKTFKSAAVRIPSDVQDLENRGIKAKYISDILWTAASFYRIQKIKNENNNLVGFHFLKNIPWITNGINLYRQSLKESKISFNYLYLNAFLHYSSGGDYIPSNLNSYEQAFYGGDPIEVIRSIATLDCAVSQRLHVGVIALSLGIPFLSVAAHPKVEAELNQVNWNWLRRYDGFKPRKLFGSQWLAKTLKNEITLNKIQSKNKLIKKFKNTELIECEYIDYIRKAIY
jgi:polysaccharide pyruvyl transferase WcaK-like protein